MFLDQRFCLQLGTSFLIFSQQEVTSCGGTLLYRGNGQSWGKADGHQSITASKPDQIRRIFPFIVINCSRDAFCDLFFYLFFFHLGVKKNMFEWFFQSLVQMSIAFCSTSVNNFTFIVDSACSWSKIFVVIFVFPLNCFSSTQSERHRLSRAGPAAGPGRLPLCFSQRE